MFSKDSRYAKVAEYSTKDSHGNISIVKKIRIAPTANGIKSYVIKQGDRLDLLSYRCYANPSKFWIISDANKEMYPDNLLRKGKTIAIGEETFWYHTIFF